LAKQIGDNWPLTLKMSAIRPSMGMFCIMIYLVSAIITKRLPSMVLATIQS